MQIKIPFVFKAIDIKINGLEKVLEDSFEGSNNEKVEKKFNRYTGTFLIAGNNLIRIPRFPGINYIPLEFDCDLFGVYSQVVRDDYTLGKPHGHFLDGSILDFSRKGYFGKANIKRYFTNEAFSQELDRN